MKRALIAALLPLALTACSLFAPAGPPPITPTPTAAPAQPGVTPTEAVTVTEEATSAPTEEPTPATAAPTLPNQESGPERTEALLAFKDALVQALNNRDWDVLRTMMDNGVNIIGSPQGLFPADTAIAALQEQLASDTSIQEIETGYVDYADGSWQGTKFEDTMFDVTICCGSEVYVAAAVLVDGWGAQGDQQALLVIQDRGINGWVWYGYLPLTL